MPKSPRLDHLPLSCWQSPQEEEALQRVRKHLQKGLRCLQQVVARGSGQFIMKLEVIPSDWDQMIDGAAE